MFSFFKKKYAGCKDVPDNRDFQAEHVLGNTTIILPEEVNLLNISVHNQGKTNHCTSYGLTHIHEILNTVEFSREVELDPEEQWHNQKEYPGTAKEDSGDSLQSALASLKRYGLSYNDGKGYKQLFIENYAVINKTIGDFKGWLSKGFPIYTGTAVTSTNYTKAKTTGIWGGLDGANVGGHCIAIVGYNKDGFVALNSYGPDWGKYGNGIFIIKYDDVKYLFTSYIIYDRTDIEYIFKDVAINSPMAESIKWALDNKIVNGYGDDPDPKKRFFKPNEPITRAEQIAIIKRLYDLIKNNSL